MSAPGHPPLWHYVLPDPHARGRYVTAVLACDTQCFAALESFPSVRAAQEAADDFKKTLPATTAHGEETIA